MARIVKFEGRTQSFPDGTSDEEIRAALGSARPDAIAAGIPAPRRVDRAWGVAPSLGGLVGQIGGAAAGIPLAPVTAGMSIPLGAMLGGAIGQGGGSALQQHMEGRPFNLAETGQQASMGGATAGLGELASGALNTVGRGMLGASVGNFDPAVISALQRERIAPSGSAAKTMGARIEPIALERQAALDASVQGGQRWHVSDATKGLRDLIDELKSNPLDPKPAIAAEKRLRYFERKYGSGPIDARRMQEIKEAADTEATQLWKAAKRSGVPVSTNLPTQRVLRQQAAIANSAREALSNVPSVLARRGVNNVSDLNDLMSPMMGAKESLRAAGDVAPGFSLSRPKPAEVLAAMLGGARPVTGHAGMYLADPFTRALAARLPAAVLAKLQYDQSRMTNQ